MLPTRVAPVQFTVSSGDTPIRCKASEFIGLTVDPGGYSPWSTLFINGT